MSSEVVSTKLETPKGVMLNAYPDSVGGKLADIVAVLKKPELRDVFSLFYILPTFFNSDLDRGFSIIDYELNDDLVSSEDLAELDDLNIKLKFDLVLNHLSVGSPQFQDMLKFGDQSQYRHFFIDWNEFWRMHGEVGAGGYVVPKDECLQKLFMRKPGFPILSVRFPDGSDRPYWNTFYQEINYRELAIQDLSGIEGITPDQAREIARLVNSAIAEGADINGVDLGRFSSYKEEVVSIVERNRDYLGQMDLNAQSEKVWEFYDSTLSKLHEYGAKMVRLDAFAYLHKQPGMSNFFNKPGTWDYLDRLKGLADKYELILLPEIHSEYGAGIHDELAKEGYTIYDFFFPGLVIDALDRGTNRHLLRWIGELKQRNIKTVNMLGCHDGIPVLDLAGKSVGDASRQRLLSDEDIDAVVERIMARGGRVKNLYGPDGKKISYYQVNATFFSALGEDEQKLRLARAIQLFMPGIPQVWYLDLFAGKNDYAAADKGGTGGHKEINRTNLTIRDIEQGLKQDVVQDQLQLMRLRNTSPAFEGELEVDSADAHRLQLTWRNHQCTATLDADLRDCSFSIAHKNGVSEDSLVSHPD
jgi:sucrose phosphorylase